MKRATVASILIAALATMGTGCGSDQPKVKGKVTEVYFKEQTFSSGPIWTARVEQRDGTVIPLKTVGDEEQLKVKVKVGDCIVAEAGSDGNIRNQSRISVITADNC